jgi:beta-lactamase class A
MKKITVLLIVFLCGLNTLYAEAATQVITRRAGIYRNQGDEAPVTYISPQAVTVLAEAEGWLQISTWMGPMWLNPAFMPPHHELDSGLRRFGSATSVYYKNLETGYEYFYNGNRTYFSASIAKAPLALYIYEKAERGETDLDERVTITQGDMHGGSGVIRLLYPVGHQLTQREILRLNLSESDNTATKILARLHGLEGYKNFLAGLGGNPNHVGYNVFNSNLTMRDAALYANRIYEYVLSNNTYSEEFADHLFNNQFPFLVSDYPIAGKTGWTHPSAWHEMAYICAPSPYLLVVLSRQDGVLNPNGSDYEEISKLFQDFNHQWFVNTMEYRK